MDKRPAALHPTIPLACPQLSARGWHSGGHLDIGEDIGVVTVARVVFIIDEDSRQPWHHDQGPPLACQQRRTHQTLAPQAGRRRRQTVRGTCSGVSGGCWNTGGDTHPEIALAASAGILDGIVVQFQFQRPKTSIDDLRVCSVISLDLAATIDKQN